MRVVLRLGFEVWRWPDTDPRRRSPFIVSWARALDALETEVAAHGWAEVAVSQCDRALESHPGVVVRCPGVTLRCDTYHQTNAALSRAANLHAIVRTLAAYRQLDRDAVVVEAQAATPVPPGGLLPT